MAGEEEKKRMKGLVGKERKRENIREKRKGGE